MIPATLRLGAEEERARASAERRRLEGVKKEAYIAWALDPVRYVREALRAEPDTWQLEGLEAVKTDPRLGLSACAGPGKSAFLAWVGWWFLDTRKDAQVIATSVTGDNLRDGLWKELAVWHRRAPHLEAMFEVGEKRIVNRQRPTTWWMSARTWARDADPSAQASALGGFHGRHVMFLMDEIGTLPDPVMVTAERIFANADLSEAKLVAAWNPESVDGAAYRISTRDRRRWRIIHITGDPEDPRRSQRISKDWAQQQIDDWGRDNDWVRVNVLGLFPLRGEDKLLGPDDITKAQGRDYPMRALEHEASVWGLDVARSLAGDRSVLRERCGPVAFRPFVWRGLDGPTLAQRVSFQLMNAKRSPDYLFVDAAGVGASAYDHLVLLGWGDITIPVDFAGEPQDPRYMDKSAEMHGRLARWVRERGALPLDSRELGSELTTRGFWFKRRGKRTAYCVESKEDLKDRGLPSPDEADALALTFAEDKLVQRGWIRGANPERRHRGREAHHEKMWGRP